VWNTPKLCLPSRILNQTIINQSPSLKRLATDADGRWRGVVDQFTVLSSLGAT
jgi:hypothetical protein